MNAYFKIALTVLLTSLASHSFAAGALALDANQGQRHGFSYNYAEMGDAEQRALQECGANCQVVLRFTQGCAAYAADQTRGSTVYGWATDDSESAVQQRALSECGERAGKNCIVRVWACESN